MLTRLRLFGFVNLNKALSGGYGLVEPVRLDLSLKKLVEFRGGSASVGSVLASIGLQVISLERTQMSRVSGTTWPR